MSPGFCLYNKQMKQMSLLATLALAALGTSAAFADCVSIEPLLEREARLEKHVSGGAEAGYISAAESDRFKKKLQSIRSLLTWYKNKHCMSSVQMRDVDEELTGISVQIFRALRRGGAKTLSNEK
jgi:hypothetical protein